MLLTGGVAMTNKQFLILLTDILDEELEKDPEQMDTDFIDSCLELLS